MQLTDAITPRQGRDAAALTDSALAASVGAILSMRLSSDPGEGAAPVCIALSGGGDSVALLLLAADWARANGRRFLALTVDHRLNPASADWTAFAGGVAADSGADWRALVWKGDKPTTGLTAAARAARHRLIADAAREAGARVVLFAHTADDVAEADWMRAQGSTLGRLREWSPSPVWPEGRGLMLLRPLLGVGREALRGYLAARGADWIEDPGNSDPRFGRSRARAALAEGADETAQATPPAIRRDAPPVRALALGAGFETARDAPAWLLARLILVASGGERPVRGDRLSALCDRLAGQGDFTATLGGARIQADGGRLLIGREAGEMRRRPIPDLSLDPGCAAVWDGRFEITTSETGWRVTSAAGLISNLSPPDRAALKSLPPWARATQPLLIREDETPVLAWRLAQVVALAPRRLQLALAGDAVAAFEGETTQESALDAAIDGETPPSDLFLQKPIPFGRPVVAPKT